MEKILAGLAILASGIYAGAAWYLTVVELPALRLGSTRCARAQWVQTIRWTPRYAASALIATVAALGAGHAGPASPWTWGAALIFSVLPVTVLVVLPIQRRLLESDDEAIWAPNLLTWSRLHGVRMVLGLAAAVTFISAALAS
jgi:hypothetical protein